MNDAIGNGETLWRGIKKRWLIWDPIDNVLKIAYHAYLLRPDEFDISVVRASKGSIDEALQPPGFHSPLSAAAGLETSEVRDLGLEVKPKSSRPARAGIWGCPSYGSPEAIDVASELVRISQRWASAPSEDDIRWVKAQCESGDV